MDENNQNGGEPQSGDRGDRAPQNRDPNRNQNRRGRGGRNRNSQNRDRQDRQNSDRQNSGDQNRDKKDQKDRRNNLGGRSRQNQSNRQDRGKTRDRDQTRAENRDHDEPLENGGAITREAPKPQDHENRAGNPLGGGTDENGEGWFGRMRDALSANDKCHNERLATYTNFGDPNKSIRFVPLGGLDQIGGNIAVFETEDSAIVIDAGMSFPTPDMHGVDILVPDFSYLHAIKHKIKGIIITHAHEDHIGAVPYLFKELQVPLYGTPLPLAMIGSKFDEHRIIAHKSFFRFVEKRKPVQIGDFEVEWIHMTHSVIDACSLAITTAAGTVIHTGDFKLDNSPIDGLPPDYHRLAHFGERGVLALFSDSTNSFNPGMTKSESIVGKTFDDLFAKAKGRVIMSTFSSNTHRIAQAIESGRKFNRKVAVIGRSMEKNLHIAMELGYVKFENKIFIDAHEVAKYADNEVLVITTGSQGESQAALFRMSINEHRHIQIKPTDTIVISAKAIPGNEASISAVINQIAKCGASIAYQEFSEIHVSGHAAQEEQKFMIRLVKPRFFIPVHGEYQHLLKHKETAMQCGIAERNIAVIADGEQIELSGKGVKKVCAIRCGKTFIDNQSNREVESDIVFDRQNLAKEGIIVLIMQIDKSAGKSAMKPKVMSYGLVAQKQEHKFNREIETLLDTFIEALKPEDFNSPRIMENNLRQAVKKHIFRTLKKYPIIVPNIFVQ
ncbi:MAG: RNase J family beta-CASP ribonuclease [Helicobacteraceae bacterium]|jgi:ribonuclease J|nr:RNase J family beta-CASP ribonuclease [Helicobacteraceae bacterium]